MNDKKERSYVGKWRIPLGIAVNWAIPTLAAMSLAALRFNGHFDEFVLLSVVFGILFLFFYGLLGFWLIELDYSINPVLKYFGLAVGYIGMVVRPIAILSYGSNKKWILLLTTSLPMFVLGIFMMFFNLPFGILNNRIYGILLIASALLILTFKSCKNCGCVMCKIDMEIVSVAQEQYYKEHCENIGYIRDKDGKTTDIYMNYTQEHDGMRCKLKKVFDCGNCGARKFGFGLSILERKY